MKRTTVLATLLLVGCLSGPALAEQPPADSTEVALIQAARQAIDAYHQDAEQAKNVIRVVYFHPQDREPLKDWQPRLTRIIADVSEFYRTGLRRFGIVLDGMPFEQDEQGFVIHLARGKLPASKYDHDSGDAIRRELLITLGEKIDFQREHVLVVHGLCHREEDGRYVFNAPYYGYGSQRQGFCHAADCELLDPRLLEAKDRQMVYTEHYYPRVEQTVAKFNSWYLGGLAHELGHGLGLPHDAGQPGRTQPGTALMGMGNHHYREDLWGGRSPSYLSSGSALRLVSHPLITQSNRERFTAPETKLASLTFAEDAKRVNVVGTIQGKVPAYGIVAYLWRPPVWPGNPKQNHRSFSHPAAVANDQFDVTLGELRPGDYRLRLSVLHCSGAARDFDYHLKINQDGQPNVAELNADWLLARAEKAVLSRDPAAGDLVSPKAIAAAPTPEARGKLRVLSEVVERPVPIDLATTAEETVSLSDASWLSASVGWGKVARNFYDLERKRRSSIYLELKGKFYDKGLYAHSASTYAFDLDQRWKTLTATVGLRDGASQQGSAVFTIKGDGKELFRSPMLRAGQNAEVKIDVSRVAKLELVTEGGEDHVHNSWAIWAAPLVTR